MLHILGISYTYTRIMSIYEDTYNAVLDLPCVQRIIKKNKKLRKENKALRSLIRSLPEFRQQPHCCSSYNNCSHDEPVKIKIEPVSTVHVSTEPVVHFDDIKIIKTLKANPPENIVYHIEEAEAEEEEEYTEEEIAYNKIDDVMFNKKCLNTDMKKNVKLVEEEEEEEQEEEEEEEEVFEIEIDDKTYYTNNEENGIIYEALPNDEVGDKIGYLKDGEPFFTNIV